jgi:hypothetical protein
VTAEKTKYIIMSRDQNAGQNYNEKSDNQSFDRVEVFKYLGKTPRIEILFGQKLRTDCSHGVLAIVRRRIFCVPGCHPKI